MARALSLLESSRVECGGGEKARRTAFNSSTARLTASTTRLGGSSERGQHARLGSARLPISQPNGVQRGRGNGVRRIVQPVSSPRSLSTQDPAELTRMEHRSWSTALVLLEAAGVTGVLAPAAADFVSSHKSQLERPHDPFARTENKSTAAAALVPAATATATKHLVQAVADRFDVDDAIAHRAVETATRDRDTKGKRKEETALSPDEWDRATAWVFEERMAVIGVVALLLRTRAFGSFFGNATFVRELTPYKHARQTTTNRIRVIRSRPNSSPRS